MKPITDLIPEDKGSCCIVTLDPKTDKIVNRAIFNFDYLEKMIKEIKKTLPKSKDKKYVEIQFVTSEWARLNKIDKCAITMRVRTNNPDIDPSYPPTGFYTLGPRVNCWGSMYTDDLIMNPDKPLSQIVEVD